MNHCHDKLRSMFTFKFITQKYSHHDVFSVSGTLIMMMMDKVIESPFEAGECDVILICFSSLVVSLSEEERLGL